MQDGGRGDTIDLTDENHPLALGHQPVVRLGPVLRVFHHFPLQLNQTMKMTVALSIAALAIAGIAKASDETELKSLRTRAGKGVEKIHALAVQRANGAADKSSADAMNFVGHVFLRGSALKGNPAIAFGHFKTASSPPPTSRTLGALATTARSPVRPFH